MRRSSGDGLRQELGMGLVALGDDDFLSGSGSRRKLREVSMGFPKGRYIGTLDVG